MIKSQVDFNNRNLTNYLNIKQYMKFWVNAWKCLPGQGINLTLSLRFFPFGLHNMYYILLAFPQQPTHSLI